MKEIDIYKIITLIIVVAMLVFMFLSLKKDIRLTSRSCENVVSAFNDWQEEKDLYDVDLKNK